MRKFLEQLNSHVDIWHKMSKRYFDISMINSNRKYNKSVYQSHDEKNIERTSNFNRDDKSPHKFINAYNNSRQKRQERNDRPRVNIIIKIENRTSRNDREFDKNVANKYKERNYDRNKQHDRRTKDKDIKNKAKTFVSSKNISNTECDLKNYHQFENLAYYDFDYEEDEYNEFDTTTNVAVITSIICRQCKVFFSSNNALHKHLKFCRKKVIHINEKNNNISTTYAETITFSTFIRRFNIDSNKNIDDKYNFKKWQYASAEIVLFSKIKFSLDCLNTDVEIILSNIKFFKTQCKNISIRIMTFFIAVRDLSTNKHSTDKYVIMLMSFSDKDKHENSIKTLITREIHLIDDLKANILIENDILNSEKFDISLFTFSAHIESCDVTISISVKNRSTFRIASVYAVKFVTISFHSEQTIVIHKIFLFDRHYIFESTETNFSIYLHVVNITINVVLIRNEKDKIVKISRNFRLEKLMKLDYSNAFLINHDLFDLVIRNSKSQHKISWFRKVLTNVTTLATIHISMKISTIRFDKVNEIKKCNIDVLMTNEIIAHNSFKKAIETFSQLINEYSKLWTNQEFVNLSGKNWMKLSLKSDWELTLKEKIKFYSLDFHDKAIIDDTFTKLHAQK